MTNISSSSNTTRAIIFSNDNNTILNNSNATTIATSGAAYGIYVTSACNNTQIINTTASSLANDAIDIDGGINTSIDCKGASITGTNVSNAYGIYSTQLNTTVKNCIISNFTYDIYLSGATNGSFINNTLIPNTANTNGLVYLTSASYWNTFYWNNFTNTSGYYVQDLNGSNYYNSSTEGNVWYDVQNLTVKINGNSTSTGYPSLYIGTAGTGYPYNNTTSSMVLGKVVDWYPLTPTASALACKSLSTAGTTYTMSANASISGADCFDVTAANITLNCNGYSITGNNATGTRGVYSTQFNTTIQNCNILNFSTPIYFNAASNGTISNVSANTTYTYSYPDGVGIVFYNGANYNQLSNINTTSLTGYGLLLYMTNYNTVSNSIITSNNTVALYFLAGNNNTFKNSTASSTSSWSVLIDGETNISLTNDTTNGGVTLRTINGAAAISNVMVNNSVLNDNSYDTALVFFNTTNCSVSNTMVTANYQGGVEVINNSINTTISNISIASFGGRGNAIYYTRFEFYDSYKYVHHILCCR